MAVAIGLTTANKKRNNKSNTRKGEREMCLRIGMPDILFKYYKNDPKYNEARLNGELYFASPLKFNDVYDCQYPEIINNTLNVDPYHVYKILEESGLSRSMYNVLVGEETEEQREIVELLYRKQLENIGILCLTRTNKNMPMWGLYAGNDGICIEYDMGMLKRELPLELEPIIDKDSETIRNKRICSDWVTYDPELMYNPNLFLQGKEDMLCKYWHKLDQWKHEEEYRIGVSLGGDKKVLIPDCVKHIYLGPNMTLAQAATLYNMRNDVAYSYMNKTQNGLQVVQLTSEMFDSVKDYDRSLRTFVKSLNGL